MYFEFMLSIYKSLEFFSTWDTPYFYCNDTLSQRKMFVLQSIVSVFYRSTTLFICPNVCLCLTYVFKCLEVWLCLYIAYRYIVYSSLEYIDFVFTILCILFPMFSVLYFFSPSLGFLYSLVFLYCIVSFTSISSIFFSGSLKC